MSEIKRAPLISFDAPKENDKKCKEVSKTVRISVILPQSNEDTCPEYNYKEELAKAKKKDKTFKTPISPTKRNGLDPFDDDDDDVRRIAQEMEAKYGGVVPKKKKKGRRDDYADIGMGYDESDSFIDNTDGYDEIIPQNVTTLHGGFYINCGALVFKTDDEASSGVSSSESEDEKINKPASRKRILDISDDDSEGEKETDSEKQQEKKQKLMTNGIIKVVKKKFINSNSTTEKLKQFRKKKPDDKRKSITVKDLLKEKRIDLNMSVPEELEEMKEHCEKVLEETLEEPKESKKCSNISDIIESVIKGNQENSPVKVVSDKVILNPVSQKVPDNQVETMSDGEASKDSIDHKDLEIVKLPENLSTDIVDIIQNIKDVASSHTEGKVKFFAGPVKEMLLSLERKCKCLGRQSRVKVYEHLAPFVKCRKETLIKRAKNLVIEDEQKRISSLLSKLKTAIDSIMPSILENYEIESQKVLQRKFSKESIENEENKHLRMPKRRFSWNEDTKKILKEIITLQRRCYLLEGKNKDSVDTLLQNFLKADVQPLWPDGWMSINALQKFVNNVVDVKKTSSSKASTSTSSNGVQLSKTNGNISISTPVNKDIQLLPKNTNLSITPVLPNSNNNVSSYENVLNKPINIANDITVDRVNLGEEKSKKSSISDLSKAPMGLTITPANNTCAINLSHTNHERKSPENVDNLIKATLGNVKSGLIIKEDINVTSAHTNKTVISSENNQNNHDRNMTKTDSNSNQPINLAESSDIKKQRQIGRPKTAYIDNVEKGLTQNEVVDKSKFKGDVERPKVKHHKEERPPSQPSTFNTLFSEFSAQILKNSSTPNKITDHSIKKLSAPSNYPSTSLDYSTKPISTEGDAIQKVMEDLKALQQLSSPNKHDNPSSSKVSVIAYNKTNTSKKSSGSHSTNSHSAQNMSTSQPANMSQYRSEFNKTDFGPGFQEAFQRQLLNEFGQMKNPTNSSVTSTSSKSHYNSNDKFAHTSGLNFPSEKYFQNPNNNFPIQNSSKLKSSLPTNQAGSYNLLDDMLSNFFTEYGYQKTANHKPKAPQK